MGVDATLWHSERQYLSGALGTMSLEIVGYQNYRRKEEVRTAIRFV